MIEKRSDSSSSSFREAPINHCQSNYFTICCIINTGPDLSAESTGGPLIPWTNWMVRRSLPSDLCHKKNRSVLGYHWFIVHVIDEMLQNQIYISAALERCDTISDRGIRRIWRVWKLCRARWRKKDGIQITFISRLALDKRSSFQHIRPDGINYWTFIWSFSLARYKLTLCSGWIWKCSRLVESRGQARVCSPRQCTYVHPCRNYFKVMRWEVSHPSGSVVR